MPPALTEMEALTVCVTLATGAMEHTVMVRYVCTHTLCVDLISSCHSYVIKYFLKVATYTKLSLKIVIHVYLIVTVLHCRNNLLLSSPLMSVVTIQITSLLADIDECDTGDNMCHVNATCANTDGSYDCKCESGFSGDGRNCSSKLFR